MTRAVAIAPIQRVLVVGAGQMGRQIAVQCAQKGLSVCVYDADPQALQRLSEAAVRECLEHFAKGQPVPAETVAPTYARIDCAHDPRRAGADCDLLIEAVSEKVAIKRQVFAEFNRYCPPQAIFATNSSVILPSALAESTGRPAQFAALHFALGDSIVEVMPHAGTAPETISVLQQLGRRICDVCVLCRREHPGHVLNALYMSLNATALTLAESGIASIVDIDRIWMKSSKAAVGPFAMLDFVGLDVAASITETMAQLSRDPQQLRNAAFLKKYVQRGWLGVKTGNGFYRYPRPGLGPMEIADLFGNDRPPPLNLPDTPTEPNRIMSRFVLRMREEPLPEPLPSGDRFHGPALIVGDNSIARALQASLGRRGTLAHILPVHERTLAELDQLWQREPLPHLFVVTARDGVLPLRDDPHGWLVWQEQQVLWPFLICQRWYQLVVAAGLAPKASVVAVTALGGDLGLSGKSPHLDGGALSGLVKSLRFEVPAIQRIKVIDAPPTEQAERLAEAICRELAAHAPDVEVGYVNERRMVVRAIREPAAAWPRRSIERGSVWIVTGGARGVTAAVARELGRRYGLRLHLIGTSPAPQIRDDWRNLSEDGLKELLARVVVEAKQAGRSPHEASESLKKALELDASLRSFDEAGVCATYHSCDVSDWSALERVLNAIRSADGPITGVLHGAGLDFAGLLPRKTVASVARVLAPKLSGTAALMALTRNDPLRFFVGFGSTSGRFGAVSNADYAMANDLLAKMINRFRHERPETAAFCVHWTAWDEAGMCMRPAARLGLRLMKVRLMPLNEGIEHLIDELTAASPDSEILIVDHPGGVHSQDITLQGAT